MWGKSGNPKFVVIGASAGVGRATALAFARRGAHVALLAREPEALEEVAAQVRHFGMRALPVPLDVSDADAVDAAAGRAESRAWSNRHMGQQRHADSIRAGIEPDAGRVRARNPGHLSRLRLEPPGVAPT